MEEKISVIMACYNCEKTLEKAIDSILEQTYTNWIMICCDDGSTDRTLEILQAYQKRFPDRFLILQNGQNRKLPYSLNHCLRFVNTSLVARMDADDWSMPERFETEVRYLKEHPECDLVSTGVTVSDGEKKLASIIKPARPTRETVLKMNPFSHATIMTYRQVYDALGGYSEAPEALRVEDFELWCRFLAAGFVGHNIPDELYVILENDDAVKRRNLKARLNGARIAKKGYQLLGYKGLVCYKPYFSVLKAFVPTRLYHKLHQRKLQKKQYN